MLYNFSTSCCFANDPIGISTEKLHQIATEEGSRYSKNRPFGQILHLDNRRDEPLDLKNAELDGVVTEVNT